MARDAFRPPPGAPIFGRFKPLWCCRRLLCLPRGESGCSPKPIGNVDLVAELWLADGAEDEEFTGIADPDAEVAPGFVRERDVAIVGGESESVAQLFERLMRDP